MRRFNELNTVRKELIQCKVLFDEKGRAISFNTQKIVKAGKKSLVIELEYFDYGDYEQNKLQILNHVWFSPADLKEINEKRKAELQLRKVG